VFFIPSAFVFGAIQQSIHANTCIYLLGENVDFSGRFTTGATVLFTPRHTNF